jgi:hypothetical protein
MCPSSRCSACCRRDSLPWISAPTGQYDLNRVLNLGPNCWVYAHAEFYTDDTSYHL